MKKTKALVSAAAGAALLLTSGATFALWSVSTDALAADIHTGNLEITPSAFIWTDVSPYVRSGTAFGGSMVANPNGQKLPEGFRMVPGDKLEGRITLPHVTFEGDNLLLEWWVNGVRVASDAIELPEASEPTVVSGDEISHFEIEGVRRGDDLVIIFDWTRAVGHETANGMGQTIAFDEDAEDAHDINFVVRQVRPGADG